MRTFDQLLQRWRIFMAANADPGPHDKVLDIGCFQGEFSCFMLRSILISELGLILCWVVN